MATAQAPGARRVAGELPPERMWTADEVRELVDERRPWPRFECARGRLLVTPSGRSVHQVVVTRLSGALLGYCTEHFPAGTPLTSPADISWGRDDVTLQPDVFVVPTPMIAASNAMDRAGARSTDAWREVRHLLLAAEVLSDSTAQQDREDKRLIYQAEGTPVYWVVDWRAEVVEEWTPEADVPRLLRERLVWRPAGAATPFELSLPELLRPF